MADEIYYSAAYGGKVVIKEEWPQKIKEAWYSALGVKPPSFVPTFRQATGSDGTISWNLNDDYFPSKETAQWIADKYGDGTVTEVAFGGSGGLFTASEKEYHVTLKDGRKVNAGILAAYYTRNPDNAFPGLANMLIRKVLGLA